MSSVIQDPGVEETDSSTTRTRAFRYELKVNKKQQTALYRHAGAARFTYNWGLTRRQEIFHNNIGNKRFANAISLHRELNQLKKTEDYAWLYSVSKCAPQEGLRNLDTAFSNFFTDRKKPVSDRRGVGFPRFKKKGRSRDSFRLTGTIKVFEKHIQLPRLGRLRLKETTGAFKGQILSATLSRESDNRWFVSLTVKEMVKPVINVPEGARLGIDLGLTVLATFSDEDTRSAPKPLKRYLTKLRRLSRQLSRKVKGSYNWRKAVRAIQRLHFRISSIRKNFLHELTTYLAKTHSRIVIEKLGVQELMSKSKHRRSNKHIRRAIADVGWFEFRRQLEYKCKWYGSELIIADQYYPSSQLCSNLECDYRNPDLTLEDKKFHCPKCGLILDRDLNAARNLEQYPDSEYYLKRKKRKSSSKKVADSSSRPKTTDGEDKRPETQIEFEAVLDETVNETSK